MVYNLPSVVAFSDLRARSSSSSIVKHFTEGVKFLRITDLKHSIRHHTSYHYFLYYLCILIRYEDGYDFRD